MRVIHRAVVALALVTLLALAGSAAAQSNPPAGQILTRDDVSLAFEGLWEGGCSSFGDTTTCNFQENGTPSMIDVVVRVPIEGTGASAQTLDDWRTAIDTLAGSSGLTIEAIPDVGDAALALLGTDGTAQRLEFYAGGATGSIIPRLDRPVAGRDLGGLARTAIPRLGDQTQVPISTNAPVSTNGPVPSVAAPEPATPEPTVAPVTPELATLPTPSFTGMTLNQARALAISVGVNLSSTSDATSDQPDETVLSQSPEPGTPIASGSFVDIVVARAAPGPAPTATTTLAPVAAPVQAPGPSDISLDPVVIVTSAAAAAGIVLLIPFPSALFNSTLEANYAEIRGWFRFRRRKRTTDDARTDPATSVTAKSADEATAPDTATSDAEVEAADTASTSDAEVEAADMTPTTAVSTTSGVVTPAALTGMGATIDRFWSTRAGVATFFVLAGLLYGFLDPTFGLTVDSVLLFVGILGALVVGSLVATATFRWARVRLNGEQGTFRVLPTTLVIALVCVLTTRITDFQPGYLYGVLAGLLFVTSVPERASGREYAITGSVLAGLGVLAFVVLGIVRALEGSGGATGLWRPIDVTLSALVIGGFEGLLFGMLPLTGLPGAKVKEWDARVWALLLFLGAALFLHVIVNPSSGYLVDSSTVPLVKALALLIAFAGLSVGLWAWFRYRPMERLRRDGDVPPAEAAASPSEADVPPSAPGD